MAKPKLPSERPPVPASSDDRWDVSDDPAPAVSVGAPVAPSSPPPPTIPTTAQSAHPPAPSRANDPLRTTLALGDMSFPLPPSGVSSAATSKPPSSAPGPAGAHREAPPTPTLALESKGLHQILVAKVAEAQAERAAKEAAKSGPSVAPPSAGVPGIAIPAAGKPCVGGTTLAMDDSPPVKAPSSAGVPAHPSHSPAGPKSERPAATTMIFTPSELVKAAQAKSTQDKSEPKESRVGGSTLVIEPNAPAAPPVPSTTAPSSAGRIGAPAAALSKTLVEGPEPTKPEPSKPEPSLRGTLVMAAPLAAMSAAAAKPKPEAPEPEAPKPEAPSSAAKSAPKPPKDGLSSTIVGMAPVSLSSVMGTAMHEAPAASPATGPVAAAKSAPSPMHSLAQTLAGTGPSASIAEALAAEQQDEPPAKSQQAQPVAPSARASDPAPAIRHTNTLRDGTPDASSRTVTTPSALAATLAHDPVEAEPEPVVPRASDAPQVVAKIPARDSSPSTPPRSSRPVIASMTPSGLAETQDKSQQKTSQQTVGIEVDEPVEVGESALRIALAAAGTIVVASAIPALVRDPIGAATWTIPGVIALVLAFVPVGHATRALLAFAPALPALAVRAMGCEGHTVSGALALTALAVGLPAALIFRAYFAGAKRSRAFVAAGLALGLVWALLPGGGAVLAGSSAPWAASHLPALSLLAVAALSMTALLPGRTAGGARGWALLAIGWTMLPALGSRAENFGPRALDALSLAGLTAIASMTLAALLAVYATPEHGATEA
jgi:hypothetical protein